MTLKELRKKFLGSHVRVENLPDAFCVQTNADETTIEWQLDDEYVYSASIHLDSTMRIKSISRMSGKALVGDDATRVNYRPIRISADDYDILEAAIESILAEAENDRLAHSMSLGSLLDSMGSQYPIYLFSAPHELLGVVGSEKIGTIADEERNIPVKQLKFNHELGYFVIYAYLLEDAIPGKWK